MFLWFQYSAFGDEFGYQLIQLLLIVFCFSFLVIPEWDEIQKSLGYRVILESYATFDTVNRWEIKKCKGLEKEDKENAKWKIV